MSDTNARFEGNIPEAYDRELGPVLFEPYATDLARRIDVQPGQFPDPVADVLADLPGDFGHRRGPADTDFQVHERF